MFWLGPNCFDQVTIILVSLKLDFYELFFVIWTPPKCSDQIELDLTKNELDLTKIIWTVQNYFGPTDGQGIRAQEPFYPVNTLIL